MGIQSLSLSRGLLLVHILTMLPILVVGIVATLVQFDNAQEKDRGVQQSALRHAELGAGQFQSIVDSAEALLISLGSHPTLLTTDPVECTEHLATATTAFHVYSDILAVRPDGHVVCDSTGH